MVTIQMGEKFSERHLDSIIKQALLAIKDARERKQMVVFDLSDLGYISNQELLVFTALLSTMVETGIGFKVNFLKEGSSQKIDHRKAKQLVQIWEVWQIYKIVPYNEITHYFDIDGGFVVRIKEKFGIKSGNYRIYNRYGVTPFVTLNKISNYDDRIIGQMLNEVYRLNAATNEILKINNCELPFKNKTLSLIITKELYENFLDHASQSSLHSALPKCFLSLSLKERFNEMTFPKTQVQTMIAANLKDETLPEFNSFYYDNIKGEYKNQSILQLTFLDFGEGIPVTLKSQYLTAHPTKSGERRPGVNEDSLILEYAFRFDSSKDPIEKRYLEKTTVPRGLFDLLSIVKRFNGLLVVRSGHGRILYDFAVETEIEKALKSFDNASTEYFPGTLISVYIPERQPGKNIDHSVITPPLQSGFLISAKKHQVRISLFSIQKDIKRLGVQKKHLYNNVFRVLHQRFSGAQANTLFYVDFDGYDIDERITKKVLYFLTSDYHVNSNCSVIVLNPPPREFLDEISKEMYALSEVSKNYYFHPTPFAYYSEKDDQLTLYWLGVFNLNDIAKLGNLLQEQASLRLSDFEFPSQVLGNVNSSDKFGNVITSLNERDIITMLREESFRSREMEIHTILSACIENEENKLYLCNGNYYQEQFIQLARAINDRTDGIYLCNILFEKIRQKHPGLTAYKFICISAISQKILSYLEEGGRIPPDSIIRLDNYYSFRDEMNFKKIPRDSKVILVCDNISSGYLATSIINELQLIGTEVMEIAVIVDATCLTFEPEIVDYAMLQSKLTSLYRYEIPKIRHEDAKVKLKDNKISLVRINPYSNTLITEKINETYTETIALNNRQFLDKVGEANIKAGYYRFNNLIHPYFFDMDNVLKNETVAIDLLQSITKRPHFPDITKIDVLYFPKGSGIKHISKRTLREKIFNNHELEIVELERFSTPEGWKFLHPDAYVHEISFEKKVMIIDDGSCSGESIIQMIDEVASMSPKDVTVLSIVGRINDQKRDFFSRIHTVISKDKAVALKIYFGSHWHIPTYYMEESPVAAEIKWLNDALQIPNIPFKFKPILKNVLKELELKEIDGPNNDFILKNKDNTIPIKDLTLVREQLGQVASYRFYKDDFKFFNNLVATYPYQFEKADQTRMLELVCGVLLHEPALYDKIYTIVPDVVRVIQDFILRVVLFGSGKAGNNPIDKQDLYYEWSNLNLLHLLFIAYKNDALTKVLDTKTLNFVIKTFCKNETDVNYLLYRILRYIPISEDYKKNDHVSGKLRHVIEAVAADFEENNDKKNSRGNLKIFNAFIATLPFEDTDYQASLGKIRNNYMMVIDDKFHNEYIYNDKQILSTQLSIVQKHMQTGEDFQELLYPIKKAWASISSFVIDMLSFDSNFPGFILPINRKLGANHSNMSALREVHGEINELLFSDLSPELSKVKSLTDFIFENYIYEDSLYPYVFTETTTKNIRSEFEDFLVEVQAEYKDIIIEAPSPKRIRIDFPKLYLKEIVFKEVLKNLRHANLKRAVKFIWTETETTLLLRIENYTLLTERTKGGGKGIYKLQALNSFPVKTRFKSTSQSNTFIQNFLFTKI